MLIFELAIKISLILTFIFYLVFFFLCLNWAKVTHPEKKINLMIASVTSLLYSFWFFLACVFISILVSLFFKYYPTLIDLFKL
jgi:ABC-type branched-subunit amino acid transport system permease subunit